MFVSPGSKAKPSVLPVRLILPPLHDGQKKFVFDPHRFVYAACGSKTGKTFGMGVWLTMRAWQHYQSMNWWCAPTMKQARIAFNQIGTFLPPGRYRVNRTEMVYELLRGNGSVHSRIEFRSGDRPESLRGEGVHNAVVDEASYWNYDSFVSVLTTLTRTKGFLRVISTPKGRNWFWEEWTRGWKKDEQSPEEQAKWKDFSSHQLPTHSNPIIEKEALEFWENTMPRDVFRQEILAEFLDDAASVFKNISELMTANRLTEPRPLARYVLGIDWAKHEDYTVLLVMDADTKEVVYMERYQDMDWNLNIDRAYKLALRWNNAVVWMDSTGAGDVPFDHMRGVYPYVNGYSISTNERKAQLIQGLQLGFEQRKVRLFSESTMKKELEMFGLSMSGTGKPLYSAPDGYHDDTVIALALAYHGSNEQPILYRGRNVRGI